MFSQRVTENSLVTRAASMLQLADKAASRRFVETASPPQPPVRVVFHMFWACSFYVMVSWQFHPKHIFRENIFGHL